MSTYSPNLRIQLIATGDQVGTWGTTTNTNLGTLLEDAISGYTSVSVTSSAQALTANNGSADQSRNVSLALTTTTTAAFAVYAPPAEKTYVIYNASAYTATIYNSTVLGNTTAAGTGVAIPAGKTVTVWSDGTDFRFQNNHLSSLTLATDLAVADGGTGASTASDARTNLGLGTIATQNSNSVTITGGAISGVTISSITDLAVTDGGTGSSTAAGARSNLGAAASGANSDITSLSGLTTALSVAQGGTGGTTSTGTGAVVLAASPTLTGTPLVPTASAGTNTTQIASTAFVTTAIDNFVVQTADIADSAVTTAKINNSAVTTAKLADANVTLAKLSATGTASSSTFLRGDYTWAATPDTGVGSGQSWQNVTGSRSSGTTYTNSTGKPIMVNVVASNGSYTTTTLTVSGLVVASCSNPTTSTGAKATLSAIVPNGENYSSTGYIDSWFELR